MSSQGQPWWFVIVTGIVVTVVAGLIVARLTGGGHPSIQAGGVGATSSTPATTAPSSVPTNSEPSASPSTTLPAESATPAARIFLTDLDSFEVSTQWSGAATVNGQTYAHSVIECDCNGSTVYANLERRFSMLQATIGITDDAPTDTKIEFDAYSEQGLIFSRTMGFGQSAPVSINVAGVLHLELKVVQISPSGTEGLWAAWGNAELTPGG